MMANGRSGVDIAPALAYRHAYGNVWCDTHEIDLGPRADCRQVHCSRCLVIYAALDTGIVKAERKLELRSGQMELSLPRSTIELLKRDYIALLELGKGTPPQSRHNKS